MALSNDLRSMAGFSPDRRRPQSGKERQYLRAPKLSLENGLPQIVDIVNLKDVLGQIQPDHRYLHNPPPPLRSPLILRPVSNRGKRGRSHMSTYVAFQMAEVAIPGDLFADILRMIAELRPPLFVSTA